MRLLFAPAFTVLLFACSANPPIPTPGVAACTNSTPRALAPFDSLAPSSLVGQFRVTAINTVRSAWHVRPWTIDVVLRLRDRARPARPRIDPHPGATLQGRARFQADDSTDIVLLGSTLDIGRIGVLDAGRHYLRVEALTRDGFRGQWRFSGGLAVVVDSATGTPLPDPGGHFCATRLSASVPARP